MDSWVWESPWEGRQGRALPPCSGLVSLSRLGCKANISVQVLQLHSLLGPFLGAAPASCHRSLPHWAPERVPGGLLPSSGTWDGAAWACPVRSPGLDSPPPPSVQGQVVSVLQLVGSAPQTCQQQGSPTVSDACLVCPQRCFKTLQHPWMSERALCGHSVATEQSTKLHPRSPLEAAPSGTTARTQIVGPAHPVGGVAGLAGAPSHHPVAAAPHPVRLARGVQCLPGTSPAVGAAAAWCRRSLGPTPHLLSTSTRETRTLGGLVLRNKTA